MRQRDRGDRRHDPARQLRSRKIPTIVARVAELAAPIEELKVKVIGESADAIEGSREVCRAMECPMGNLVADAMLDRVKDQGIQIAIQNGGGLRASIDAGEVTMGEVLTVLPFQNTLATFQLRAPMSSPRWRTGSARSRKAPVASRRSPAEIHLRPLGRAGLARGLDVMVADASGEFGSDRSGGHLWRRLQQLHARRRRRLFRVRGQRHERL
jgi:hypothetical protein